MKSAGGGEKLFPNKPLPSSRSPWQKKQCFVYKAPPLLRAFGSFLKGLLRLLRAICLPLRVKVLGTSSDGGEVNPHVGADVVRVYKRSR